MTDAAAEYMAGYNRPTVTTGSSTPEQKALTAFCLGPLAVVSAVAAAGSVPSVGLGGALLGLSSAAVVSIGEVFHSDGDFGDKALSFFADVSVGTLATILPGKGIGDTLAGATGAVITNGIIDGSYSGGTIDPKDAVSQGVSVANAGVAYAAAAKSPKSGRVAVLRIVLQTALELLKTEVIENIQTEPVRTTPADGNKE